MQTVDYAWAAGFIDGEGTISIKRYVRPRVGNSAYIYYVPYVSLAQAIVGGHEKGVVKMHEMFGGSISQWRQTNHETHKYSTVQWSCVSRDAEKCIKLIYPFLIVKKENAELLLRWYKEVKIYSGGSKKVQITPKEHLKRAEFFDKSRLLNQKGALHQQRLNEAMAKANVIV